MEHAKSVSVICPCLILPDKNAILLRYTQQFVESLQEHTVAEHELILVDNGSPVGAEQLMRWADVYIRNKTNLGYGPAVNQGLRIARGEWLVVSNNDITFIHDWIGNAIEAWTPETGLISSHLHGHDKAHRRNRMEVPWGHMMGALWMTHQAVIKRVGFLDEEFERGMYEDADYFVRIEEAGYKNVKAGWCLHVGNSTWGKLPRQKEIYLRNRDLFERKWPGRKKR